MSMRTVIGAARRVFLCAAVALVGLAAASADLSAKEEPWIRLYNAGVDARTSTVTLSLRDDTPRIRAIKFSATRGDIVLTRIVVSYANGQVHFEERPLSLRGGERSRAIDERPEARIVESISLTLQAAGSDPIATDIEVWGLGAPAQTETKARGTSGRRYAEVSVYFGTTRQRDNDRRKNDQPIAVFNGEAGTELTLGRSLITVPVEREAGSIPRPSWVRRITFGKEDPNRDFTIAAVDVLPKDEFVAELRKRSASSARYKGQVFVFVHGYNVGFDDALFRTAQIAQDIGFDGPVVTFSWPARGGTWDYVHDLNTAKSSRDGLRALLELVAQDPGVTSVNLIAHSMGNDPVIEVLRQEAEVAARGGQVVDFKLNEVVMAAPDVSRGVFEKFVAQFVPLAKGGITLYASSNDRAMAASKRVASGIARAGDVPKEGIVIVPGIESIDVSLANTDFFSLNHNTFAVRENLVTDVRFLFERTTNKHPPHVRFSAVYQPAGANTKQWWRYKKN